MCLIIDKKQCPKGYKIAKKNILCYKMLLVTIGGNLETPTMRCRVSTPESLVADTFQTEAYCDFPEGIEYVEKGIHSYTTLKKAKQIKESWECCLSSFYKKVIIKKAYIPKGTKYWVGKGHEFCSERIVFAEK